MFNFLKNRLLLLLVLAIFVICKIPHLYYPYFWDESWVYAPAVLLMAAHGPSLMPDAIDVNFSRGHPLFFHAIFSIWVIIFGHSHFSMHLFALVISCVLMIAVYEVGLKLFNKRVAITSVILLALNIDFFTQSAFVLPDMLIALLMLLSFYFYATEKYFLTALFLSMLFFTKESGLVVGVIIGADAGLSFLNKNTSPKNRLLKCASVLVPLVLISFFFIIQKHTFGWYFYPAHTDAINIDLGKTIYWLRTSISILFQDTHEYYLFLITMLFSILAAVKHRIIKYIFIFLPALFICFLSFRFSFTEFIYDLLLLLFFSSFIMAVSSLTALKYYTHNAQKKFVGLITAFSIIYLYFSSINFYEVRYLFPVIVLVLFLISVLFDLFISRSYPVFFYPTIITITGIGVYLFHYHKTDSELGAFDRMDIQQQLVDHLEQHNYYDKNISCVSYIEAQHLKDPATGYLRSAKTFKNVNQNVSNTTELAVFDNMEPDEKSYNETRKNASFHLLYRIAKGTAWIEVYQRNQPN